MKAPTRFRFKQFSVWHHKSAMKVGVDAVLLGSWADVDGAKRILDVGCGCGVIALMMAQRNDEAIVDAIDIDKASVTEAKENFISSPWADRLNGIESDFNEYCDKKNSYRYDLIVSNPPYFDAGIQTVETRREKARHQDTLSPSIILAKGKEILNSGGRIAMILPTDVAENVVHAGESVGLRLIRLCKVKGHPLAPSKRVMMEWILPDESLSEPCLREENLTLESSPGVPTPEHKSLCGAFYLKF